MLILYRICTFLIISFLPLILIYRLIRKKDNYKSIIEKLCIYQKKHTKEKLIWFHGASVGELQSIVPLLEIYEKNKNVKKILITSNTLSSYEVISNLKIKKVVHQYFPLDFNHFSKKFINHWSPSAAFFVDSEIWPNMIFNLKKNKVPIILLNGRITKRSFKKWKIFSGFANKLFSKFDLCLSSSKNSTKYLKNLGAKNIKNLGNLKFTQSEKKNSDIKKNLKKFIKTKKVWCASSTHFDEEKLCGLIHKKLKKKYKNLLTIIIPRHINRVHTIKKDLLDLGLNIHLDEPKKNITKDTDIYLVNTYGKTKTFYANCKNVFLGGSIINHGGQNPLEATRFGCNILHGKNVSNFQEIYKFLSDNNISQSVNSISDFIKKLDKLFSMKKITTITIKNKIDLIGSKVLSSTHKEINLFLKNDF